MNLTPYIVTKEFRSAIREIPLKDLEAFLESMRQVEYKKLPSVSPNDLTALQARVNMITAIEQVLVAIQKPTK